MNAAFSKLNIVLNSMTTRCPPLPDAVPGLRPGDLNKMFERIVETAPGNRTLSAEERQRLADDQMTEYSVIVHSRPSEEPASEVSVVNDKPLPPWVIVFNDFVTVEECDAMIQLGYKSGYKRSEDVGEHKFDGTTDSMKSKGRTSENAWCTSRDGCKEAEVTVRLHNRMSKVMGIPPENSEDLQLLKYEVGQAYNTQYVHSLSMIKSSMDRANILLFLIFSHDYIPHQKDRQCGPRILTFFIYLSDVEAGGGTDFPDLGLTVMPKKGRAILWPSVYDADPFSDDQLTRHQALPVEAGTKFAANGWIHMYDYVGPQVSYVRLDIILKGKGSDWQLLFAGEELQLESFGKRFCF
jgi:prolyl 4-hydroxylase